MTAGDLAAALDAVAGGTALGTACRAPGGVAGIGIDAVDLGRFRAVLGRRPALAGRLFTDPERSYAGAAADPVPRLATRFAAKEAVLKALGVGLGAFRFAEVEVVREGLDAPVPGPARVGRGAARAAGVVRWHLSLTHTDQVAMAMVVAEGRPVGRSAPTGRGRHADAVASSMQPVLTIAEMQAVDAAALASTPLDELVERAGTAVAVAALDLLGGAYGRRVLVIAGKGNNGADGRVAASLLRRRGARVAVVAPERPGPHRRRRARPTWWSTPPTGPDSGASTRLRPSRPRGHRCWPSTSLPGWTATRASRKAAHWLRPAR